MATVTNEISLIDSMSPVMKNVIASLKSTITLMHDVSKASTSDFAKAEMAIQDAANAMDKYEKETAEAKNKQNQLNSSLGKGQSAFGGLLGSMKGLIAGYVGIQSVKGFVGWSDEMTQTSARLSMVNDGLQSNAELQEMIYQSAQNSRSAYGQTADIVAKIGLRAGDIFKNNKETVRFSETLNKMFGIAGASEQEQHSASLQLTQALGSGVLRGEEFNAVFEAAPNVMQAVAKSMGKPIGELRNLATEGKITAETVKNAILKASIDIDNQFALMPMTWSQIWTKTVNYIQKEAWPLQKMVSDLFNSKEFQNALAGIVFGMKEIVYMAFKIVDFIVKNWDNITDVCYGVLVPLALISGAYKLLTITASTFTFATKMMTIAQVGFNAALLACPAFWIIGAVLLLVGAVYLVVQAYNSLTGSAVNASEVIVGIIMTVVAALGNAVGTVWNLFLDVVDFSYDVFSGVGNFLHNMVSDTTMSMSDMFQNAFISICQGVLRVGKIAGGVLDQLFGTETVKLLEIQSNDLEMLKHKGPGYEEQTKGNQRQKLGLDRIGYGDAFNSAKDVLGLFKGGITGDVSKDGMSEEMRKYLESLKDSGKQTAKNTEKFKLDERGLALLTEYAKNEWNRTYNTMRNSTKISFNGPIHQSTDVRAIAKEVEGMMLDSYTSLVGA